MKNLIIFIMLFVGVYAYGQNSATADKVLGYDVSWYKFDETMTTDDNINATDSVWTYTIYKNSYLPVKYDVRVSMDSISGAPETVVITLQAKKWLEDASWTTLNTATWTNGSDTIIAFKEDTLARQYQYFKLNVAGANNTFVAKIKQFFTKFWN